MGPRDEMFINHYRFNDEKYIETIRPRHDMYTDAWLCNFKGHQKQFITSFNAKEEGWLEKVTEMAGAM